MHCSLGGHLPSKEGRGASGTPPRSSPQRTLSSRSSYRATHDSYFKQLCSSYSSLSYCMCYSATKQSSSPLRV